MTLRDALARALNEVGGSPSRILAALRADPAVTAAFAKALHRNNCGYSDHVSETPEVAHEAEALALIETLLGAP